MKACKMGLVDSIVAVVVDECLKVIGRHGSDRYNRFR